MEIVGRRENAQKPARGDCSHLQKCRPFGLLGAGSEARRNGRSHSRASGHPKEDVKNAVQNQ